VPCYRDFSDDWQIGPENANIGSRLKAAVPGSPETGVAADATEFPTGTKEGACMAGSNISVCTVFEVLVVLFQLCGVMGLCLHRLMPNSTRWASRGLVGFIVGLFGLGIAGALCGRHDSEFALFAGGTMTVLLIGMTVGGATMEKTEPVRSGVTTQPELAV
jgi:hypothetical protein